MGNAYLDALNKRGTKDVELKPSERRQAMLDQKGKCAKCKHDINPVYSKFVRNPLSGKMEVLCANCAVEIPKR
jgi:hypothetical protein